MKEKKKTEIATNLSSGAEKVETIEEQVNGSEVTRTKTKTAAVKTAQENAAAHRRVEAALKKEAVKEAAEKRAADREKEAEQRKAERIARAEKKAAERKARAEKIRAEEEEFLRELAHRKANRAQERSRRKTVRRQQNEKGSSQKGSREERRNGYGGWLAAVISLGAVNLALTTAVTLGAINMKKDNDITMAGYRGTMYEIMEVMEHVDDDLDRARIAATPEQQDRILTDLLVQARLVELDLEKLPISAEADRNVTTFINRVAHESEKLLSKLRHGETLSEADEATLQKLYETNHQAREQLHGFMEKLTDKDIMSYVKKGDGILSDTIEGLEKLTLEENRAALNGHHEKTEGAGTERNRSGEAPEGEAKIDPSKAEDLCKEYFSSYKIEDFQCIGETVSRGMSAYNVQGYDDKGTMLFAEIDKQDGALLRFDYYEDCNEEKFDLENTKMIAESFVEGLGYGNMSAVRVRENGTSSDFTFVYEADGIRYYPDELRVKVCGTRGVVTGFDATRYVRNHKDRSEPSVKLTLGEAQGKLKEGVEVESSNLAVVRTARGERAAYEFLCSYKGEKYFIYTDAVTGEEISIVNVNKLG